MDANHERTLQEAARWHARLQATDCSETERAEYERWLLEAGHASAMQLARRVDASVDALASAGRLLALTDSAFASSRVDLTRPARRWIVPAALAASLVVAAFGLHYSLKMGTGAVSPVAYTTSNGQRSITLADGSTVHLDVASGILVRMTNERRDVELVAGRAYFEVAHDVTRPFAVTAAGSRTTALGTRFQVEREAGEVTVTLADGSVAVDNDSRAASTSLWSERLQPGEQLRIDARTAVPRKIRVDPQVAISWTHGRHVFRGTPLAEALDEVNRYAATKVRLGDPSLADLEVAGSFIAGDSEAIVAAFAAVLPLRSVTAGEKEILLFRRYDVPEQ